MLGQDAWTSVLKSIFDVQVQSKRRDFHEIIDRAIASYQNAVLKIGPGRSDPSAPASLSESAQHTPVGPTSAESVSNPASNPSPSLGATLSVEHQHTYKGSPLVPWIAPSATQTYLTSDICSSESAAWPEYRS